MSASDIETYLIRLDKEIQEFKNELSRISWYMRGGVTVQELLHVYSADDRDSFYSVIKENIDMTKETKMPLI
jgi:hypothetical protein